MVEVVEGSCLNSIQVLRVSLVDELEGRVESLLENLVTHGVFGRDDREQVLCHLGPRARVRQVLDIVQCKGEEAAKVFLSINSCSHLEPQSRPSGGRSAEFKKILLKHKDVLRRRSETMLYYNTRHGEKILFSEHYVSLLLVDGHQSLDVKRHEVLTFGHKRLSLQHKAAFNRKISPKELFTSTGSRSVKKVLVTGVAGIGKTILVQKMLFDFGRGKEHREFDFIIHMTFRDLNLIENPTTLRDLILRKNRHLAKELDNILANDDKLLMIFDGFDEFKHYGKCDVDSFVSEPDEDADVVEIFGSLMQGELLPNASVLLTSRPTAVNYIPVGFIDRFVLISGFSLTEVQEYFSRYFQDETLADQMFAIVAANELMLTLCYIPAFCYIVCCILKDNKDLCGEGPKTMTDIYVQYLVAMLRSHAQTRAETLKDENTAQPLSDVVLKLGQLAFHKLMEHQTLFYSSDSDVKALEGCALVSAFLDKTMSQEPGCVEEVYSFAHLTVQEFFAAMYCAVTDEPFPEALQNETTGEGASDGHLDLFSRFLSGVLSERNANLLSRHVRLTCSKDKMLSYREVLIRNITLLCENGGNILNNLHCLLEQQDPNFGLDLQPKTLRINVSDETLSEMDYNAIKYFLNLTYGAIEELDLTGTGLSSEGLTSLYQHLIRCERLWLGDNALDMDMIRIVAGVLRKSDVLEQLGIGWANIGDDELLILSSAIRDNKQLKELWMEGNRVSQRGLQSLADLTPHPLMRIVAIWNDLENSGGLDSACMQESISTNFTDDDTMWDAWGDWVLKRCEVISNDKLLTVLHKVCNIPVHCREDRWAKIFYKNLHNLIETRIESCTEEDTCKKLKRFQNTLCL
ncbi:protein NLRC3-like [Periophthalmus magnuspinnatus]|uniref:protein NLRC3-like n=1 Tax=Periophthalmus magnuspinnatus TaxID=409849 RepID=UPI0024367000|nr:protein NLRC3-like [Periophthalmus magnuspinnatus]